MCDSLCDLDCAPGNGPNVYDKYFKWTFTEQGKYENQVNHQKINGKNLMIMALYINN